MSAWWNLPRAPGNPGILWWDKWLVALTLLAVGAEMAFRTDLPGSPWVIVVGIVIAGSLLWRRTHPLLAVAAAFAVTAVANIAALINEDWNWELFAGVAILLIPYSLMRWGSGREGLAGIGIIAASYLLTIPTLTDLEESIGGIVVLAIPAIIGAEVRALGTRRRNQIKQARIMERGELARELHDTVAHHVSAIAVQAQAGRELAKADPASAVDRLGVIEAEATKTLREMRAMVGALRSGGEAETSPRRGIADLEALAATAKGPLTVNVEMDAGLDHLEPTVDSAIYRMAQESLTNSLRHATGAKTVQIRVSDAGDSVHLEVEDDGIPPLRRGDTGYGLIGMEERAQLLGGTFRAGPSKPRGWIVEADLPKNGAGK